MQNIAYKSLKKKNLPSILAVFILGSLNHFLYDWTGGSSLAALFCPINESPWEHLKLLFFPFLFVTTLDRRFVPLPGQAFFLLPFSRRHLRDGLHSGYFLHLHRYLGFPRSDPGSPDLFSQRGSDFSAARIFFRRSEADPLSKCDLHSVGHRYIFLLCLYLLPAWYSSVFPCA